MFEGIESLLIKIKAFIWPYGPIRCIFTRTPSTKKDLNLMAEEVPLLAGEVVNADQQGTCAGMNAIIATLPETLSNSHVISSAGCTSVERLHFNSAGYRELGKRYAEKMLSILSNRSTEPK